MPRRIPDEGNFWIYNMEHPNRDHLAGHLEDLLSGAPKQTVSIFIVVCKQPLKDVIFAWHDKSKFDIEKGKSNDDGSIFSFKLAKVIEGSKIPEPFGNVVVIQTSTKAIYYVMTDEKTPFVKDVLRRFLNSYYPDISRVYISSDELRFLLERLENTTGKRVIVDRITAYARIPYEQLEYEIDEYSENLLYERKKQKHETIRTYTKRPYKDAFDQAIANDQWVDKIRFHIRDGASIIFVGFISRSGVVRLSRSFFPSYQTLAPMINEIVERKFKLYSNRARSPSKPRPSPLVIQFDHDIFTDPALNKRFVESLRQMTFISISVYHANPYLHLSLVDYLDGSSFELWVFSADKITIVPQLRASEASLNPVDELLNKVDN
jgi:hypothetical protein